MKEELSMVISYLDKIGEKLGAGTNYFWPVIVKQQYVDSFVAMGFFILCLLIEIIIGVKAIKVYEREGDVEIWQQIVLSVFGLVLFFSFVAFVVEGFDFINAEYWALKDLLQMVK